MIITYEQLTELTGCKRPTDMQEHLKKTGVRFLNGKNGRPYTTLDALNAAMNIKTDNSPDDPIDEIRLI